MTGPIYFSNDYAFAQLRDEGVVFTFRDRERTTGDTWCARERGDTKEFDVHVEYVGPVSPTEASLRPFADRSGFHDVVHWLQAINEIHNIPPHTGHGYIYKVTRGHDDA